METHGFLFGQTATTFSDKEANGYTLIHNGVTGHSQLRVPMVRYTVYGQDGCSRLMVGLESGFTDYMRFPEQGSPNMYYNPVTNQ